MLGDLSFWYGNKAFSLKCSNTSKVMQLLLLLLTAEKEGMPRVQLLETLYGDAETQDAKNAFRILVFPVKKVFGGNVLPDREYIHIEKGIYRFSSDVKVEIDAKVFAQRAKEAFRLEDKTKRANAIKRHVKFTLVNIFLFYPERSGSQRKAPATVNFIFSVSVKAAS